jgi:hypothetical protein
MQNNVRVGAAYTYVMVSSLPTLRVTCCQLLYYLGLRGKNHRRPRIEPSELSAVHVH